MTTKIFCDIADLPTIKNFNKKIVKDLLQTQAWWEKQAQKIMSYIARNTKNC